MWHITQAKLKQTCSIELETVPGKVAAEACQTLGPLSRWWLRPEVLRKACERLYPSAPRWMDPTTPQPPESLGSCWIVCVLEGNELPLLRPAFPLPLRWEHPGEERDSDRPLPESLRRLAERIVTQIDPGGDWVLRLSKVADLSAVSLDDDLELNPASGWASLSAGLIARTKGLTPRHTVWASGAWNETAGLDEVRGLPEKLKTAEDFGATSFFVPLWQITTIKSTISIKPLFPPRSAKANSAPKETIESLVAELVDEPIKPTAVDANERDQQFRKCLEYHALQKDHTRSGEFYRSHLRETILERCRAILRERYGDWRPRYFVTIVSGSPDLAVLNPLTARPDRCLLLHTSDNKPRAEKCRQELLNSGIGDCELKEFFDEKSLEHPNRLRSPEAEMRCRIREAVAEFTADESDPCSVAFDVKPGSAWMKVCLTHDAEEGNWLFNLETGWNQGRFIAGTERIELLQVGRKEK